MSTDYVKISSELLEKVVGCLSFWAMTESSMRRWQKRGFVAQQEKNEEPAILRGDWQMQTWREAKASPFAYQGKSEVGERQIFCQGLVWAGEPYSQLVKFLVQGASLPETGNVLAVALP